MKIIDLISNEIACKTYKHLHGDSLYQIFAEEGNYFVYLKKITPAFLPHNNDITRIQIPNLPAFNDVIRSTSAFFAIGYDPVNDVYAIWNPDAVKPRLNKKTNISLYSTFSGQQQVRASQKPLHYVSKQLQDAMIVPLSDLKAVLDNYSSYFNSTEMPELPNMTNFNPTNDWETPFMDANGKLTKLANPKLLALLKPCFGSPYPTYVQAYNIIEDFYGMDRFPKMQFKDWEYLLTHIDWNSTIITEPVAQLKPTQEKSVKTSEKNTHKKSSKVRWSADEMIVALDLYFRLPFGKFHKGTPEIIELAKLTGRTPSSIAMRLSNYEIFNSGKGLDGGKEQCQPYWDKYVNNRSLLEKDAKESRLRLVGQQVPLNQNQSSTHATRERFWSEFIEYNKRINGPYANSKSTTHDWLGKTTLKLGGVAINIIIQFKACRSEIFINTGSKEKNKRIFDFFYAHRQEIEKEIPNLEWQRLDKKITSRICIGKPLSFVRVEDKEAIFTFFIESTDEFMRVFAKYADEYKSANKSQNLETPSEERISPWKKFTKIFHKN